MPSPFQNLAASMRQDYVTVVWTKVQKGTATSKSTCLPFRPYGFSGVVMLCPRCFIIWWCWWELVNTWQILSYKVILIWYHLFNIFWSLPYPLDILHWSCQKHELWWRGHFCVYLPALRVLLQWNHGPLLVSIKNAEGNSEHLKEGLHMGVFTLLCIQSPHTADLAGTCPLRLSCHFEHTAADSGCYSVVVWREHYPLT